MTGSGDAWRKGESRRRAVHADQAALLAVVLRRGVCDATGEPLDVRNAVAMTVTVAPGVSRLAVVTRAHWEGGTGALSSADPAADKDVLDGRRLFGDGPPPGALTKTAARAPQRSSRVRLLQQPQRVPRAGGQVPRA
jgi:hypothetical protein